MPFITVNTEPTAIPEAQITASTNYLFQNQSDIPIRIDVAAVAKEAGSEDGYYLRARGEALVNRGTDSVFLWTDNGEGEVHISQYRASTGSGSGSGSGGGSGGIPATALFQSGLSNDDIREHKWRGLMIGLERAGAGPDWKLTTVARDATAVDSQATVTITVSGSTLALTLPTSAAVGAAGNSWSVVFDTTTDGALTIPHVDTNAQTITLRAIAGTTDLSHWATAWNDAFGAGLATFTGNANLNSPTSGSHNFSGGTSVEPISASMVVGTKTVTVRFASADTIMECRDAWEGFDLGDDTTLRCKEVGATSLSSILMAPDSDTRSFSGYYSEGSLPQELTESDVDARITSQVTKTFVDALGVDAETFGGSRPTHYVYTLSHDEVSGTGNAIILTPDTPLDAYVDGVAYLFVIEQANPLNGVTVDVSGLGPKDLVHDGAGATTPLSANELERNALALIQYDLPGDQFEIRILPRGAEWSYETDTSFVPQAKLHGTRATDLVDYVFNNGVFPIQFTDSSTYNAAPTTEGSISFNQADTTSANQIKWRPYTHDGNIPGARDEDLLRRALRVGATLTLDDGLVEWVGVISSFTFSGNSNFATIDFEPATNRADVSSSTFFGQVTINGAWEDKVETLIGTSEHSLNAEEVRDVVAAFLQEGTNVTITHDDAANTLTISASGGGGGGGLDAEAVRDTIATFIQAGSNITVTHDDAANTLTIASTASGGASDPKTLVSALQWNVDPAQLTGRTVSDFERTFRLEFESPSFDLSSYYFEPYVGGQRVHARTQWSSSLTHFDAVVNNVEATAIVGALPSNDHHFDVEIRFFEDSTSTTVLATTTRRLLIVPQYAARLRILPESINSHDQIEGTYTLVLDDLQESRLNGLPTAINHFNLRVNRPGGVRVIVYDPSWTYTARDQEIRFDINTAGANAIGASSGTDYLTFQLEFVAVSEVVAYTNPVVVPIGTFDEFPARRSDLPSAATETEAGLVEKATSGEMTAGTADKYPDAAVVKTYVDNNAGSGGPTSDQVDAAIEEALPPFAKIEFEPDGLSGHEFPGSIFVKLENKLTSREIDSLALNMSGVDLTPHASTPVTSFDTETHAVVRFDLTEDERGRLANNHETDEVLYPTLTFSYTEGDDDVYRPVFLINSAAVPAQSTDLASHEANPSAHQDSPRRQATLGLNAPVGRRVYLTTAVTHPASEHIFSVALSDLPPNNAENNPRFVGASVVDFSAAPVSGPEATSDTSGFPAIMNAQRVAGIWQDDTGFSQNLVLAVAVAGSLSSVVPTHLHVTGFNDIRAPLEQVGSAVNVGGTAYRIMRTTGFNLRGQLDTLLNNGDNLTFSLQYPAGYITATGTIDNGVDHAVGQYVSLGSGQWLGVFLPRPPQVLLAAVNGEANAGVATLTLPANYTDWRKLSGEAWDGNNNDITPININTALLAAQTASTQDFILTRGQSAANPVIIRYNTATRVLTFTGSNSNNDRIIYLVLED